MRWVCIFTAMQVILSTKLNNKRLRYIGIYLTATARENAALAVKVVFLDGYFLYFSWIFISEVLKCKSNNRGVNVMTNCAGKWQQYAECLCKYAVNYTLWILLENTSRNVSTMGANLFALFIWTQWWKMMKRRRKYV